jgi:hypothetical protein
MSGAGAPLNATVNALNETDLDATTAKTEVSRPDRRMQSARLLFTAFSNKDRSSEQTSSTEPPKAYRLTSDMPYHPIGSNITT